jgi:hypothetical protein
MLVLLGLLGSRADGDALRWLGFAILVLLPSSSVIPIADLVFEHRITSRSAGLRCSRCSRSVALRRSAVRSRRSAGIALVLGGSPSPATGLARSGRALERQPAKTLTTRLPQPRGGVRTRGDQAGMRRVVQSEIEALQRAYRTDPRNARLLGGLADGLARIGRTEDALAAVTEAIRLDPRDPVTRAANGALLMQLARPEEAVSQLEMALPWLKGLAMTAHDADRRGQPRMGVRRGRPERRRVAGAARSRQ